MNPLLITAVASGLSPIIKEGAKMVNNAASSLTQAAGTESSKFLKHLSAAPAPSKSEIDIYLESNNIRSPLDLQTHLSQLNHSLLSSLKETLPESFGSCSELSVQLKENGQLLIQADNGQSLLASPNTQTGQLAAKIHTLESLHQASTGPTSHPFPLAVRTFSHPYIQHLNS